LTFNGLHGVISQKIVLFITTAVRTLNPTWETLFHLFAEDPELDECFCRKLYAYQFVVQKTINDK
jgi:hypothetical protein